MTAGGGADDVGVADMTQLESLDEKGMLHNLEVRLAASKAYTFVSTVLVAAHFCSVLRGTFVSREREQAPRPKGGSSVFFFFSPSFLSPSSRGGNSNRGVFAASRVERVAYSRD